MAHAYRRFILAGLAVAASLAARPAPAAQEVGRPEEIKSKRLVIYEDATYVQLAASWKDYNAAYPSEYAYANWMYAARYAGDAEYGRLLDQGLKKYPANPTLLYLKSLTTEGAEQRALLERATALDPHAMDSWYALVTACMASAEPEKVDVALRRILSSGIVSDALLDFDYNVLSGLEPDAILITNGDNDTYPCWILTRIVKVRPDVTIVNRSLLNTEWYPLQLIESGLPRFTDARALAELRESILARMKAAASAPPLGGPFGDTLILGIVDAARRAGRPVYFAKTLYATEPLARLLENGRDLGLATLVTPSPTPYETQLKRTYGVWLESFRTGGLDGWRLREAPETDAVRMLMSNYANGIADNLETLRSSAPALRVELFRWYVRHVDGAVSPDVRAGAAAAWCAHTDIAEIAAWCRQQGLGK